jgi:hypothetical protein
MLGQLDTYVDNLYFGLKPILVNFQLECYSNYWIYEQPMFWYCQFIGLYLLASKFTLE